MMRKRVWTSGVAASIVAALFLGLLVPDVHAAGSCPPARKLGRGGANVLFSFTEIPLTMMDVSQDHGPVAGVTWGMVQGVGSTVERMLVGALEVVTFSPLFPKVGYGPMVQPEFPRSIM